MLQLELELFPQPTCLTCDHPYGFISHAYVPAGFFCNLCSSLVWQYWVPPDEPKRLGYVSATWAWKYKHGKEWTTPTEIVT